MNKSIFVITKGYLYGEDMINKVVSAYYDYETMRKDLNDLIVREMKKLGKGVRANTYINGVTLTNDDDDYVELFYESVEIK